MEKEEKNTAAEAQQGGASLKPTGNPAKESQKKAAKQKKQQQEKQNKEKQSGGAPSGQGGDKPAAKDGQPEKSKAELKKERREKQEAQRAAKAAQKQAGGEAPKQFRVKPTIQADDPKLQKNLAKKLAKQQVPQRIPSDQKKVGLFSHLHQYERDVSLTQSISFSGGGIHPAIIKLGLQYAEGIICGSNARCVALLLAIKKVIADYSTPFEKELSRDLEAKLKPNISFLTQCRPLSVSMGNAIKHLKLQITHIKPTTPEAQAKATLTGFIDNFIQEKVLLAGEAISKTYASTKINDGDVILTYACSSLILKVLLDAKKAGKKFRVIVVDSRPKLEGRECLRRLVKNDIKCSYVLISAVSYVIKEVSKVFLGAHALLANGYVMSRVGSSMVAMVANAYSVPVLVCCESYKFCERVQTDAFVSNELGDPSYLVPLNRHDGNILTEWKSMNSLHLLNLVYDVTPPEFVTMVITEIGMVPCTSVPVILRVKNPEM